MDVTFTRTGARRYRVSVERSDAPNLVMEPAPGFDEYLPHDLVHLLVEQHWGLSEGVYGDLAAGGDAGTFRPSEAVRDRRWGRKHAGLATSGRDMDRSEGLARAAFAAWQVHRGVVAPNSTYASETATASGASPEEIAASMPALDEAAERWHELPVGGSMTIEWQSPVSRAGRSGGPSARRGRSARI